MLINFCEIFLVISIVLLPLNFKFIANKILRSLIILPIIFCIYSLWPLWSDILKPIKPSIITDEETLVYYANVNSQNSDKQFIIKQIKSAQADVVMLVEFNKNWAESFSGLESLYPHSKIILHKGNFGLAIFSKYKIVKEQVFFERDNQIPVLFVGIELKSRLLNLALLHAFPPLGEQGLLLRDQYLSSMANIVNEKNNNIVICGDFNTTAWTKVFRDFLRISKTSPPPFIGALSGTWPSQLPFFKIKIDHCLSRGISINHHKTLKSSSSDHLPILIKVK